MKILSPALLILSIFLGGCTSTYLSESCNYKPASTDTKLAPYSGKTEAIKTVGDFDGDAKILESRGYVCIGTSSTKPGGDGASLKSLGEIVGADIVLWTSAIWSVETVFDSQYPQHSHIENDYICTASFWRKSKSTAAALTQSNAKQSESDSTNTTIELIKAAEAINRSLSGAVTDSNNTPLIPSYPVVENSSGATEATKGNFDGAIADYSKAIESNPGYAVAYGNRGLAKFDQGDFIGAIADCNEAIALNSVDDAETYGTRGTSMNAKGDFTGAMADYDKAITLLPADSDYLLHVRFDRHLILVRLGRSGEDDLARQVPSWQNGWPKTIGLYLTGTLPESKFLAQAGQGDVDTVRANQCEAFYYAGMIHLLANDTGVAQSFFEKSLATKETGFEEFVLARVELARLSNKN
jgi:tetratricopeptide (TPR) repeat protein